MELNLYAQLPNLAQPVELQTVQAFYSNVLYGNQPPEPIQKEGLGLRERFLMFPKYGPVARLLTLRQTIAISDQRRTMADQNRIGRTLLTR